MKGLLIPTLLFVSSSGIWFSSLDWEKLTSLQSIAIGVTALALLVVAYQIFSAKKSG